MVRTCPTALHHLIRQPRPGRIAASNPPNKGHRKGVLRSMSHTAPSIRNRVNRWYLVVQARRLHDAGYTQKEIGQRLGRAARTIRRWKADDELWEAALHAPDGEAVGPPLRTKRPAFDVLQQAAAAQLARSAAPPLAKNPATPTDEKYPDPSPTCTTTPHTDTRDSTEGDSTTRTSETADGQEGREPDTRTPRDATTGHEARPARTNGTGSGHRALEPRESSDTGATTLYARVPDEARRGRYVGLVGTDVGAGVLRHEADPSPLDVTGELAMARSLLESYVLAQENAVPCDECGQKPAPDISRAGQLLDRISKMVQRVEDIRARDAISRKDFMRFCAELGRSLREHCTPEQASQIADNMMSLKV